MTTASVNQTFDTYRVRFPDREPNLSNVEDRADESDVVPEDERHHFGQKPVLVTMEPPDWNAPSLTSRKKYLWVIEKTEVVFAQEHGIFGKTRKRKGGLGGLAHTNLTASRPAHSAGEAWFADHLRVVINGGSSRYRPRSKQELEAIKVAFREAGLDCISMGWDDESNRESRIMRELPQWTS